MAWQQDPALHRWYIDTWCNKQKLLVSCPVSDTFLCPTKHMTRTCGGHVGCVLVAAWQAFQRGHFALLNLIWSAAIQTVRSTPHGIVSNLSHRFWLVFSQLRINLRHWHQPSNISICCNSFCLNLPLNNLVESTPFCPTAKTADFDALFLWSCLDGRPSFKTLFLPTNSNGLDNFGPSHWAPERDSKEYWRSFHQKLRYPFCMFFLGILGWISQLSLSLSLFRNGLFGRWEFGIHMSETKHPKGLDDQKSTIVWTIQLHISPATKKLNALSMILVVLLGSLSWVIIIPFIYPKQPVFFSLLTAIVQSSVPPRSHHSLYLGFDSLTFSRRCARSAALHRTCAPRGGSAPLQ